METLTLIDESIVSTGKKVKGLYLRDLSEEQSDYVISLQELFNVKTATHAAEKALFGYVELNERLKESIEAGEKLYSDHKALRTEYINFQRQVASYFKLVQDSEFTKENILKQLSKIGEPVETVGSFRNQGSFLNRQRNGYNS